MAEQNFEGWKEIRARADSIANAVFVIAGGALSVSIAVLIGKDAPRIPPAARELAITSWCLLLYAMIALVMVKSLLVVQAYQMLRDARDKEKWRRETTWANWIFGISGVLSLIFGLVWLVRAAAVILR